MQATSCVHYHVTFTLHTADPSSVSHTCIAGLSAFMVSVYVNAAIAPAVWLIRASSSFRVSSLKTRNELPVHGELKQEYQLSQTASVQSIW